MYNQISIKEYLDPFKDKKNSTNIRNIQAHVKKIS